MKVISAIITLCLVGGTSGWSVCSPKRIIKRKIQKKIKKNLLLGAAAGGALAVGTVATAGAAAVAFNQVNNREVYEPERGSMNDQVVLITGGSSGLGLETSKRLAAAGATVVLTSRTEEKGIEAVQKVSEYLATKGIDASNVYSLPLDLDDLTNSVKTLAEAYKSLELGDISTLINNAGVMALPNKEMTVDGYERTFQSNHLGHFVLTSELFPYFSREGTKVINVASTASNIARPGLDMYNLNSEKSYGAWTSYGTSKLANILFTNELQRRASSAGLDWLTTVSLHPGVVNTELWRYIIGPEKLDEIKKEDTVSLESLALSATSFFTKTPEEGASTQIFLAATDDLVKAGYYDDMKEKSTTLPSFAKDGEKAKALWDISEELGDVTFDLENMAERSEVVDVALEEEDVEEESDEASSTEEEGPEAVDDEDDA